MEKESLKDIKDLREQISIHLSMLDKAIIKNEKQWIEEDIVKLLAFTAILGKKAGIDNPSGMLNRADKLINTWLQEKSKKRNQYLSVKELYKIWAEEYDAENNIAVFLEEQITKKWLYAQGKNILDLGCGTGRYSIPLAKKNKVAGVDFSKEMVSIAKKKAKKARVKPDFIIGDITKYKPEKKFDLIISMLVQDHIKDIRKLARVIASASRIGTELIISNIHPCYTYKTAIFDKKANIIEGFLTDQFYHPLDEYLRILRPFGFELIDYRDLIFKKEYTKINRFKKFQRFENNPVAVIYKFKRLY